jgi:DNA-binding MurR/RpiR family transcriptional regulator
MIDRIKDKIKNSTLTKTEFKIANYFLDNEELVYFKAANEIANEIGVSDSSVIRFVKMLGYAGYTEFQQQVQNELKSLMQNYSVNLGPSSKLKKTKLEPEATDLSNRVFNLTCSNLEATFANNPPDKIGNITDILLKSNQKFIVSVRGSASVAYFLGEKLRLILPNVRPVLQGDYSLIHNLADIGPNDCLFLVSFPRYSRIVLSAISMAVKAGAKIIVLTDRITSPIAKKADEILLAHCETIGFSNSYVSALFLADLIIADISQKLSPENLERLNLIEEYIRKNNINYLEDVFPYKID